ncbi:MAG: HEAT repeat domain-containing protein, partial [bacterium]|nr:HEAT repeat domain-containing protein [bacterium]
MADEKNYGLKIAELIEQAGEIGDQEFRMQIEALVEEAVEEVTPLLVPYLTNQSLDAKVRINIIRVVGYLQDSAFLIPLKKLIDKDANIRIKQQAIISVAKFNDRRALNILNTALKNLNNPMLASTINTELSRIKKNNPILGLMPRFTEGSKNPKTFKITLDILKRILTPTDATIFTKHLENPDLLVQNGSFEILCYTGDIFHDSAIFEFFEKRFNTIKCLAEP